MGWARLSELAHLAVHISLHIAVANGLALIVEGFAAGESDEEFGIAAGIKVEFEGDQGESLFLDPGQQAAGFPLVEQQRASAEGLMRGVGGLLVFRDVGSNQAWGLADESNIGLVEGDLALAGGLDLGAEQDDAGLDGLQDLVIKAGLFVYDCW